MLNGAYGTSYDSYSTPGAGGSYGDAYSNSSVGGSNGAPAQSTLRRRHVDTSDNPSQDEGNSKYRKRNVVKNLDFMFPKVDTEYTVQTDRGGIAFVVACVLIIILSLAESLAWRNQNARTVEHVVVDTSLGQRMQVNLNITFPALACVDLHVDIMDVAGDSQLNLDQSYITKTKLYANGTVMVGEESERDLANKHRKQQDDVVKQIQTKPLPADYCGPCFGAQERDDQCCNTCDELIAAYEKKGWRPVDVLPTAEQCIREGRNTPESNNPHEASSAHHTAITLGQGCNLVGHMKLNRVAGNFHIAMGEGIQRNGKHVHIFNPEETHNFNSSHIIHHLSFGGNHENGGDQPLDESSAEETPLNGVSKIVEAKHGTTGLFQYFIKIVPTTFVTPEASSSFSFTSSSTTEKETRRETNGFFFTERFRPLMKEYMAEEEHVEVIMTDGQESEEGTEKEGKTDQDNGSGKVAAAAGHSGKHGHHGHHNVKTNSVLPGVFFIYEIYPFAVEVRPNVVPITHLCIQIMATIGGVLTIVQFVDGLVDAKKKGGGRSSQNQRHPPQSVAGRTR